jgi:hypothetical protein
MFPHFRALMAFVLLGQIGALRPTEEQIRGMKMSQGKDMKPGIKDRIRSTKIETTDFDSPKSQLPAHYRCEGCRVVLEEVEWHLNRVMRETINKGGQPGELNPQKILDRVCKFGKKQPKAMKHRWKFYPRAYRNYCQAFMKDASQKHLVGMAIHGSRSDNPKEQAQDLLQRVRKLCTVDTKECPAARYAETSDSCEACVKVLSDMDTMLTRNVQVSVETVVDNLDAQCEVLPWRMVGAHRPTNILESTCQDVVEQFDDEIARACRKPPPHRLAGLLQVCKGYCKKTPHKLSPDYFTLEGSNDEAAIDEPDYSSTLDEDYPDDEGEEL